MFFTQSGSRPQPISETHNPIFLCSKHLVQVMIFCMAVTVLAKWGTALPGWRDVIASENGPVERMSAAIWLMGFTWCLAAAHAQRTRAVEWLTVAMVLLLFGLRELDAHRWSTGWNLDKLANYWNPQFPLHERLLVIGLMVLPCLIVGGVLCLRLRKTIGQAWFADESWLRHLMLGVAILVLCVTLDKVGPYVLPLLAFGDFGQVFLMEIEEFLELVLAVFTIASLWPYLQKAFNGDG